MSFTCLVCNNSGMTGEKPLMEHIQGKPHKKNAMQKACSDLLLPAPASSAVSLNLEKLFQDKIVEMNGIGSYRCVVCNLFVSGEDQLKEHILGKKHKKHLLISDSQSQGFVNPSENMEYRFPDPSKDLPTEKYKVKGLSSKKKNNMVVVLNYKDFPAPISNRQGADTDSTNLRQLFTDLGYHTLIYENLTALATEEVLKSIQNNTSMESLILIILSHGSSKYCFYTREGATMDLDLIRKKFTDTACPQQRGKPKVFLSNFCRGQDIELQTDNAALIEVPHHMVTIHASVENIMVLRHPQNGTIFISSLCKVLKKGQDLLEMYNKLYQKMKDDGGTTPMIESFAPFPEFTF